MTTLLKTPSAQYPLVATFAWTNSDAMLTASAVLTNFKATGSPVFEVASLPYGAQVTGGDLTVLAVSDDTGTATVTVGDSASAARYLGATNLKALARIVLVPTGFQNTTTGIRITIANQNGDATVGTFRLTIQFVIDGRANENLKTV